MISAGDLEKYCYCPLSWWLGRDHGSEKSRKSIETHNRLAEEFHEVMFQERKKWGLVFSFIIAIIMIVNLIALIALTLSDIDNTSKGEWLFLISWSWLVVGALILLDTSLKGRMGPYKFSEVVLLVLSILVMILSLNTITLLQIDFIEGHTYVYLAIMWIVIAFSILLTYYRVIYGLREKSNSLNIDGDIIYVGDDSSEVLISKTYGLSGKPDLIVRENKKIVLIEYKAGRVPRGPLFSHIIQLGAYCIIVSDLWSERVEKGILRYGKTEFEIDFDESLEELVLRKAEEMRRLRDTGEAHRNHKRPAKCRGCSKRDLCPESLV
ncbi:MAG TPA: Dna2/Cas4 domain-containing protein [Candidatus Methanomethylophilaceae archaeon]|nr:Dna2/Cas4 domain-containing protein [Candidatus Methanomethylophilaceae archaeon]